MFSAMFLREINSTFFEVSKLIKYRFHEKTWQNLSLNFHTSTFSLKTPFSTIHELISGFIPYDTGPDKTSKHLLLITSQTKWWGDTFVLKFGWYSHWPSLAFDFKYSFTSSTPQPLIAETENTSLNKGQPTNPFVSWVTRGSLIVLVFKTLMKSSYELILTVFSWFFPSFSLVCS